MGPKLNVTLLGRNGWTMFSEQSMFGDDDDLLERTLTRGSSHIGFSSEGFGTDRIGFSAVGSTGRAVISGITAELNLKIALIWAASDSGESSRFCVSNRRTLFGIWALFTIFIEHPLKSILEPNVFDPLYRPLDWRELQNGLPRKGWLERDKSPNGWLTSIQFLNRQKEDSKCKKVLQNAFSSWFAYLRCDLRQMVRMARPLSHKETEKIIN